MTARPTLTRLEDRTAPALFPAAVASASTPDDLTGAALADFNRDGRPDLVVTRFQLGSVTPSTPLTGSLAVALGDGAGGFGPPSRLDLGVANFFYASADGPVDGPLPSAVVAADFDGDGNPDLAYRQQVIEVEEHSVTGGDVGFIEYRSRTVADLVVVRLGNGDGTFRPGEATPAAGGGLTVGDFNTDGRPDLATADPADRAVVVLLNDGAGRFPARGATPILLPLTGEAPLAADFDRDGRPDLVARTAAGAILLRGSGDGTFRDPEYRPAAQRPVLAADLNRDGAPDLVTSGAGPGSDDGGPDRVLWGDGRGGFAPGPEVSVGGSVAAAADLNRDGWPDLVGVSGRTLTVLVSDRAGGFVRAADPTPALPGFGSALLVGDLNADGLPDLVAAGLAGGGAGAVAGLLNAGGTAVTLAASPNPAAPGGPVTLTATVAAAAGGTPGGVVTFSDGATVLGTAPLVNGVATLVVPAAARSLTAAYSGSGSFAAAASAPVALLAPRGLAAAPGPGGGPVVRLVNPDGTPGRAFPAFPGDFRGGLAVATGDLTGDGVDDTVAAPGPGGGPVVLAFDGATGGLAGAFFAYAPDFRGGLSVAVGDVTGDGVPDIVTGPLAGGGPVVRVFDMGGRLVASFFAFDPDFRGGVTVAVAGGRVVVGVASGGGPVVRVFDGATGGLASSFLAFDPGFGGGVTVAGGVLGGRAVVVAGAGPGGGPVARAFDADTGAALGSVAFGDPGSRSGVRVAAADVTGDGEPEAVVAAGGSAGVGRLDLGGELAPLASDLSLDLGPSIG